MGVVARGIIRPDSRLIQSAGAHQAPTTTRPANEGTLRSPVASFAARKCAAGLRAGTTVYPCQTVDPGHRRRTPSETLIRGPAMPGPGQGWTACGRQVRITWMRAYDTIAEASTVRLPSGLADVHAVEDTHVLVSRIAPFQ